MRRPLRRRQSLHEAFSDVPEAVIEEALEHIHGHGWEWVGVHQYYCVVLVYITM